MVVLVLAGAGAASFDEEDVDGKRGPGVAFLGCAGSAGGGGARWPDEGTALPVCGSILPLETNRDDMVLDGGGLFVLVVLGLTLEEHSRSQCGIMSRWGGKHYLIGWHFGAAPTKDGNQELLLASRYNE